MNNTIEIPWKRYALIAELAKRLDSVSPQFGKTALQKMVFLLEEVYQVDCGYDFELYSYGPFDSQLLGDLDLVEQWGCITVQPVSSKYGGYQIRPTDKVDMIREKVADFLDDQRNRAAFDELVHTYGGMTAKELELQSTAIYVERNLRSKGETPDRETVCNLVADIKPKFNRQEILQALEELNERKHVHLAA